MSASLLGAVSALGADAPEISSAVTALKGGNHDLGLGIVLGSNLFNLASLLGVSALLAGSIKIGRRALLLNGGASICVLGIVTAQLFGLLTGNLALALVASVMTPYIVLLALSPALILKWAAKLGLGLGPDDTKAETEHDAKHPERPPQASQTDLLGIVPALVSIVLGSIGMVRSATILGQRWGIKSAVLGALILAALTGIPNVVAAIKLALRRRGSAVLSEALNSNTFNLIVGVSVPSYVLGIGKLSPRVYLEIWFLVGTTIGIVAWAMVRGGLRRLGGFLVLAVYGIFVALLLFST